MLVQAGIVQSNVSRELRLLAHEREVIFSKLDEHCLLHEAARNPFIG